MKKERISESGVIGADGKLRLPMDRLQAYFREHKGERVVVSFETAFVGSTAAQQVYYYKYIIPCIVEARYKQGTRMSEENTDKWILEQYPGEFVYEGKKKVFARELSQNQMSELLEWLKQYAAENLEVFIDDPRII